MKRWSPYKIKPEGGSLISSHYTSLSKAMKAAKYLVDHHGYYNVVVRGSNVVLAKVDARGVHVDKDAGMKVVEDAYAHFTTYLLGSEDGSFADGRGHDLLSRSETGRAVAASGP